MNDKKRLTIFGIIVAIIVIVTIVIIVVNNSKKPEDNNNVAGNINTPNNTVQAPDVNPDATPDEKPSIGGTDNVENSNGIKTNVSSKLKADKTFNNCTVTNISLVNQNGQTTLTAKVSSTSTEKISGQDVKIKFFDKDGKYISAMSAYMPQIKPGITVDLVASSTSDLTNAYDFQIEAAK